MTAPKSEYRIRLVLEQREPDESLVWREAGVSRWNEKSLRVYGNADKLFDEMAEELYKPGFVNAECDPNWKPESKFEKESQ